MVRNTGMRMVYITGFPAFLKSKSELAGSCRFTLHSGGRAAPRERRITACANASLGAIGRIFELRPFLTQHTVPPHQ